MLTNQATMLTNGVEQGRHLLNGTLNNLAQELEEMSQAQVCNVMLKYVHYSPCFALLLFLCRDPRPQNICQTRRPRTVMLFLVAQFESPAAYTPCARFALRRLFLSSYIYIFILYLLYYRILWIQPH